MKWFTTIIILALVAGCSTYDVKDAGDGVYYAESPPEYTYVDSYRWPSWYGGFYYYPFYSSCMYAPYLNHMCGWRGAPYQQYSYYRPPYHGDFAVSLKPPDQESGKNDGDYRPIKLPVVPGGPLNPWLNDPRSLKYAGLHNYESKKIVPGKGRSPSVTSAPAKRTIKAPAQRYARPSSASSKSTSNRSSKSRSSSHSYRAPRTIKASAPKNLD